MTIHKHLIIAPVNEFGQIVALNPNEYTDLGPCTEDEFEARIKVAEESMRIAAQLNSIQVENSMRIKQIADGLMYAGIISNEGIKAEPFLKPYFIKFIKEYESNQTFWAKWKKRQADKSKLFWGSLKIMGTGLLSKYGTKVTLWFKSFRG